MLIAVVMLGCSAQGGLAASGCKEALARSAACEPANVWAIDMMKRRHLNAVSVVQDVRERP